MKGDPVVLPVRCVVTRVLTFHETCPQFTLPRVVATVLVELIPVGRPALAIRLRINKQGQNYYSSGFF